MSFTFTPWHNICLSLAGVVQACVLVDQYAQQGYCQNAALDTCINSLWVRNPSSTEAVYGQTAQLLPGLEALEQLLQNQHSTPRSQLLRYCMGVFHLERRLNSHPAMLADLSQRLDKSQLASERFGATHENTLASLADAYLNTLSTFRVRIQVMGEQHHLQQTHISHSIRALLLCAIRAARLWHQVGGRRWHWLFFRKKMRLAVADLIQHGKHQLIHT